MKRLYLVLFLGFFANSIWAQNTVIDSLEIELSNAKNDTSEISLLFKLANEYKKQNKIDSSYLLTQKGLAKCKDEFVKIAPRFIVDAMNLLTSANRFDEVIDLGNKHFLQFKNRNQKKEHLVVGTIIAYAHHATGDRDSSVYYENYVIENANDDVKEERLVKVKSLRKRASKFISESVYHKAILDLEEGIQLVDTTSYYDLYSINVTIADAYAQFGDYEKALENLDQANSYVAKIENPLPKMHIRYSYANFYRNFGKFEEAKKEALKGIKFAEENNQTFGLMILKSILAKSYIDLKEFNEAKPHLNFVIETGTKFQAHELVAITQYDLGIVENSNENYALAITNCSKSWKFFEETSLFIHKASVCECLSDANNGLGNFSEALVFYKKKVAFKDSLNTSEEIKKTYRLQNQFDLEKKQIEFDAATERQNLIAKQKLASKNQLIFGICLLAFLVLTILFFVFRMKQRKRETEVAIQKEQAQEAFSQQLLLSQEDERVRISRDLHDSVGQDLILLKSKAQQNQDTEMENAIATTLNNVRSITQGLHPFVLEQFGLTVALKKLVELIDENTEIFISEEIENIDGLLSKQQELGVYRIAQEALNNIIKHAETPSAVIIAHQKESNIILSIKDYGKGFNWTKNSKVKDSLGMKTLQERAKMLAANLDITSEDSKGTTIYLKIPVKNA